MKRITMKQIATTAALAWCVLGTQAVQVQAASTGSGQGWQPDKNVEIIVWSGAGGGADRPARAMQMLFQEKKMLPVPANVVNKPGANGTVGMVYMNNNVGDGHYISMANATIVTNRITGISPLSYAHVTPLALIAHDYMIIAVKPDSPYKTARDLFAQMVKDPNSVSGGINARAGAGHTALGKAVKALNGDPRKIKLVIFRSGPEAVAAVMGGHIDYAVSVAPSMIGPAKAGQVRIIAIAAPQRLRGALATAPTLKEQGMDSISSNWRMVVGPKGMTAPQAQYWDGVFGKMVQMPEWKDDMENSLQEFVYLNSRDSLKFCEQENIDKTQTMTALGLAAK